MTPLPPTEIDRVNAALREWRQGDLVRAPGLVFVHVADLGSPLTEAAAEAARDNSAGGGTTALIEVPTEVAGLVVLTQSCDIVQSCDRQRFVEVAPLVPVPSDDDFRMISLGLRHRYAVVPAVAAERLVAELDRTMTVEKPVLAGWPRTPGCGTDAERRAFAAALARKRARAAFPEDFNEGLRALSERFRDKHRKASAEGEFLRALTEIRVRAAPSWDADPTTLTFWFIKADGDSAPPDAWERQIQTWLRLMKLPPRFRLDDPPYRLRGLDDVTLRQLRESDRLVLDHLSAR